MIAYHQQSLRLCVVLHCILWQLILTDSPSFFCTTIFLIFVFIGLPSCAYNFIFFIIIITTKNVNTKYCVCFNGKIYILWWYCRFRTIYRGGSNAPNYMLCFWSNLVAYVVFSFFCNFFRRQVATGWLPHHNYRKLL